MKIGIYKITNNLNQHCYIGQSRQIEKRWSDHLLNTKNKNSKAYNYPLYRAMRKYGIDSFEFEIIEECSVENLNEREIYWIKYYKPEYNQTRGGDYNIVPQKLTEEQVKEIQQILINDKEGVISHKELGERYGVSGKDTIRDINTGRTWYNPNYSYPLHYSKFDLRREKIQKVCSKCNNIINKKNKSGLCQKCYNENYKQNYTNEYLSREELKILIRTTTFTEIGLKFGVSDNSVRRWCDNYNLPRRSSEIKKYSDEDWEKENYWLNETLFNNKISYDHNLILTLLKENPSPAYIAEQIGCSRDVVRNIAKNNNIEIYNRGQKEGKKVYQYSKNNEFIQSFDSIKQAVDWCVENGYCKAQNSGARSHIGDCILNKRKTAYGFIWKDN